MIDRWAGIVGRHARLVLAVAVLVVVGAAVYGAGVFDSLGRGGFEDPDSESYRAAVVERSVFGNYAPDVVAIYSSDDLTADDPEFRQAVEDVVADLAVPEVVRVVPYYGVPPEAGLVTPDGHAVQVHVSLAGDTLNEQLINYDEIEPSLHADGLETDLAGLYPAHADINVITEEDLKRAELLSLPLVVLLALLIFGSLTASAMPALLGIIALLTSIAVMRLLTLFTDVSMFSINVISLLGIGLAVDYSLFIVSRFREELALLPPDDPASPRVAVARTLATAGRTVMFSGLVVAASMSSLLVFPQVFLRSMGYGGIAAVLIAMLAAITVLPAILVLLGRRIDSGRLPWRRKWDMPEPAGDHGRWATLARGVMRHPVAVLAVTAVFLLAVASPFLGAKWGGIDHRMLPEDAPSRVAADKLLEFGPERSIASVVLGDADADAAATYVAEAEDVEGVDQAVILAQEGDSFLVRVVWQGNSQTEDSQEIVKELRDIEPDAGTVLVGGLTADTVDLIASVHGHLPLMAGIVLAVMLVLLFIAFGSLVLPIKAIVMNAFSITASFGVVTWIFQEGHLSGLLGFTSPGFLEVTNPILMLAILFGLSMDYEVFLLSRVRERWDATGDHELAVASGVQSTGRIITSAALLLGVVIGAFATGDIVLMKMLGVGMVVALIVDATIVRALMVPATMALLGRFNWWAPGPLRRWWERYGFREGAAHLAPAGPPLPATVPPPPPPPPTTPPPPLPVGTDLGQQLRAAGPLPLRIAVEAVAGIARTLADSPPPGGAHGEIRPGAVLLRPEGATPRAVLTPPTRAIGPDPAFAPPEPLSAPTPAADVYALGCLLWTAATGEAPFTGTTIEAVREAHRTERVPQLPGREPLTLATNRVLRLALSKDPMRRYSGAEALYADLDVALGLPDTAPPTAVPVR
ncbi:efflux RND transporter permease subunit [Nocardioides sp. HM23]|uniref:efflux RND transporter permease subunit n=1 Tax=Nocardioides bizhenqiangii TaxID=3095076 RepID=UPI002ACAE967|nr:efflux RND transporter permease subunit [Nocardioides sp. HM23]MDZ5620792.1 efflux RND transporter permease subunit [Nocardioides sp. HM23]